MAKKASSSKKSTSSRATTAKKTTVRKSASTTDKGLAASAAKVPVGVVGARSSVFPSDVGNIMLAEVVGTFILTMVALFTSSFGALFVGIALMVISLAIFNISGSHVNPAVTFGLWTMRKLKSIMLLAYIPAQFLGAFLAVAVMNLMTNGSFVVDFAGLTAAINIPVLFIELIGMAVFMFGIAAVAMKDELNLTAKSLGIGMSLTVGALVAGSMLTQVQNVAYSDYQKEAAAVTSAEDKVDLPHALKVKGAVLNPAAAVAATESTDSQLRSGSISEGEKQVSRLSLEVLIGTLVGAALGGNLYRLIAYRPKN